MRGQKGRQGMSKIALKDVSHEEWLHLRKQGIGGSDAGAICGVNPYRSALNVYVDKTSDASEGTDSEAMRQGRDLEEYVAERFMEETGLKVRKSNFLYRSEAYPFMQANVDRIIIGENAGLECKTASAYSAEKWSDGAVPESYQIQCAHYMSVMGWDCMYIACVILGKDFKIVKLDRDENLIRDLIEIEKDFWTKHVIPKVMPEPDGSKAYDELLSGYLGTSRESSIPLLGFDKGLARREEIDMLLEKLETEKREIDQKIKVYMQDNEAAESAAYRVTWKGCETKRLDTARLKAENPKVYEQYLKTSVSRRFLVKKKVLQELSIQEVA